MSAKTSWVSETREVFGRSCYHDVPYVIMLAEVQRWYERKSN